jgi:hypothetical protein
MEYVLAKGMLETWNIGVLVKKGRISVVFAIIPAFHFSRRLGYR